MFEKKINYAKVKNRPSCIVNGQKQGYFEKFRRSSKIVEQNLPTCKIEKAYRQVYSSSISANAHNPLVVTQAAVDHDFFC